MSVYKYSELKPGLERFDATEWVDATSQRVNGITVGYYHPSQANWSYTVQVELLNHVEYGEVLAETVRQFGQLVGVVTYQRTEFMRS